MNRQQPVAELPPAVRFTRLMWSQLRRFPVRGRGALANLVGRCAVPSLPEEVCVPTEFGFPLTVNPRRGRGLEAALYRFGVYEAGTVAVLQQVLQPGDVFLDVGANIGLMTVAAARAVGPTGAVHSFEPVPEVRRVLQANVEQNGCHQVAIHSQALGSAHGQMSIFLNLDVNRGASSIVSRGRPDNTEHPVSVIPIDDFVESHLGNVPPQMVKIDVEGWELEVLRGGQRTFTAKNAPAVCIEFSRNVKGVADPVELWRFFQQVNDYRVYRLQAGKEIPSPLIPVEREDQLPVEDNLFCFVNGSQPALLTAAR